MWFENSLLFDLNMGMFKQPSFPLHYALFPAIFRSFCKSMYWQKSSCVRPKKFGPSSTIARSTEWTSHKKSCHLRPCQLLQTEQVQFLLTFVFRTINVTWKGGGVTPKLSWVRVIIPRTYPLYLVTEKRKGDVTK